MAVSRVSLDVELTALRLPHLLQRPFPSSARILKGQLYFKCLFHQVGERKLFSGLTRQKSICKAEHMHLNAANVPRQAQQLLLCGPKLQ